jgi:hypothetical protein
MKLEPAGHPLRIGDALRVGLFDTDAGHCVVLALYDRQIALGAEVARGLAEALRLAADDLEAIPMDDRMDRLTYARVNRETS